MRPYEHVLRRGAGYLLLALGVTAVLLSALALFEGILWIVLLPVGVGIVLLGRRIGAETYPLWIKDTLFETWTLEPFGPGVRFRSAGFAIALGGVLLCTAVVGFAIAPTAPGYPAEMGARIENLSRAGGPLVRLLDSDAKELDVEPLNQALTRYRLVLDGTIRWMGRTEVPPSLRTSHDAYRDQLRRTAAVLAHLQDGVREKDPDRIRAAALEWTRTAPEVETALDRLTARLAP